MPAKISVIASTTHAGAEQWIEYEVTRLGSDPRCELCLDDPTMEPHAVTLRYTDNRYLIYNRGTKPIWVDNVAVAVGHACPWLSGGSLEFANKVALRLEVIGEGKPERRPANASTVAPPISTAVPLSQEATYSEETSDELESSPPSNQTTQVLLAVLLFAAAFMIIILSVKQPDVVSESHLPFPALVAKVRSSTAISSDLWVRLCEAYATRYRGRLWAANRSFRHLRDRIELEKDLCKAQGKPIPDELTELENFVKRHVVVAGRS